MAMKLDHEDLNRLIEKISSSDIQEFSLEGEDFKLEIKRNLSGQNTSTNNLDSKNTFDKTTIVNSKILSMESEIGQIKKGFIADIVATKINPIDDITSLENVQFVMKEGKIYKN